MTLPAAFRTAAQSEASRRNGLCSAAFFLSPDENPEAYAAFVRDVLAALAPADGLQLRLAHQAVQAMWREARADRLGPVILVDLLCADALDDQAEAAARREKAMRFLGTLLRYRARIERDRDRALRPWPLCVGRVRPHPRLRARANLVAPHLHRVPCTRPYRIHGRSPRSARANPRATS